MKQFRIMRDNEAVIVIELSWWDIVKLLCGRELSPAHYLVLRIPLPYAAFNLKAPITPRM